MRADSGFFEYRRDEQSVDYRRVRTQPETTKSRAVEEVVQVRYESWERVLQGLLRGEITGIPQDRSARRQGVTGRQSIFRPSRTHCPSRT